MNFLSHYFHELPESNALFVSGLAIPDLTGHFSRIYNSQIKNSAEPTDELLKQIHRGILAHYTADKKFHSSPAFEFQIRSMLQKFSEAGLTRKQLRLSVIAHIAVELMLDRQIIVQEKSIAEDYYRIICSGNEKMLANYFALHSIEHSGKIFLERFAFFKQRQFLFLFSELENIVFALNRIYGSVAKTEFSDSESAKFLSALNNIDVDLRYTWRKILKA